MIFCTCWWCSGFGFFYPYSLNPLNNANLGSQELKCRIWYFTFPRGRDIYLDEFILVANGLTTPIKIHQWETPVAFKANREGRQESQRVYFTFFTSREANMVKENLGKGTSKEDIKRSPQGWTMNINTQLDTIYLEIDSLCSTRSPSYGMARWSSNSRCYCRPFNIWTSKVLTLPLTRQDTFHGTWASTFCYTRKHLSSLTGRFPLFETSYSVSKISRQSHLQNAREWEVLFLGQRASQVENYGKRVSCYY